MGRKHLPEREIQRLERLDEEALERDLESLTPKARAAKFHELLVAYRLAARVANRAFAFVELSSPDNRDALHTALEDYAPEHFPAAGRSLEQHVASLVAVFELMERMGASSESLDQMYRLIGDLQQRIDGTTTIGQKDLVGLEIAVND